MRWPKEATQGSVIVGGSSPIEESNELYCFIGLSFDRRGNLYAADSLHNQITAYMAQIKRQRKFSTEDSDDMKRKQFHSAHQSISYFEHLSNDIIYEIFEYFDFDYICETFSNLNQRFANLIINSNLPIKINISSVSKSTFQSYYTDIIIPYRHRIKSLRITNIFAVNIILSPQDNISKLTRLETLILTNISSSYLRNLQYLSNLPKLSSLTIIYKDYTMFDQVEIYHQIFQLPVLKYFNVLLETSLMPIVSSLSFATNKYSSIEHLVIKNNIELDTLYVILSYVPQIRRLSISELQKSEYKQNITFPITLNNLTYISLELNHFDFDNFELLAKDLFHNLQVLRLYASLRIEYLDANRWQNLILSYIPNLITFDFQYIYFADFEDNMMSSYENLIKNFTTSFWTERQCFFSTQDSFGYNGDDFLFFSVKPYERTTFILGGIIEEKVNFDSVHHIEIYDAPVINKCGNYFPNTTKLSFTSDWTPKGNFIDSILPRIISLKQLTEIVVEDVPIYFMDLVKLLSVAVNLHTLKFDYISIDEINPVTIQQDVIFQLVSKTNVVKDLTSTYDCSLEIVQLLFALCPRLQHLELHYNFTDFLTSLMRLILSKTSNNNHYLSSLCFIEETNETEENLKMMIKNDKLLDDYMLECIDKKVYIWW
ncbi:unnamed protein product [Adineta steineri]|uniref:F-box domain-containing protein n=1 Tax=Adineta steineri TaxID=433720 RepID=A0A819GT14_9BILA|nr:unnamed protein product [Adineta steineri]CAF3891582.1 unnamed protein product [Adineta steineri]